MTEEPSFWQVNWTHSQAKTHRAKCWRREAACFFVCLFVFLSVTMLAQSHLNDKQRWKLWYYSYINSILYHHKCWISKLAQTNCNSIVSSTVKTSLKTKNKKKTPNHFDIPTFTLFTSRQRQLLLLPLSCLTDAPPVHLPVPPVGLWAPVIVMSSLWNNCLVSLVPLCHIVLLKD